MGLIRAHGINVVSSGRVSSCCSKLYNGLFDYSYLGQFDRPAQDIVHLMMTLLPGAISAAGQTT